MPNVTVTFGPPASNGGASISDYLITNSVGAPTFVVTSSPVDVSFTGKHGTVSVFIAARNAAGLVGPSVLARGTHPSLVEMENRCT
jgi:hypothetical protein